MARCQTTGRAGRPLSVSDSATVTPVEISSTTWKENINPRSISGVAKMFKTASSQQTSTCPQCDETAPFGTFAELGQCPSCEEPLITLCRMATEGEQ